MYPHYNTLLYSLHDGIGELTLNRPEAGNTFTAELLRELTDATTRMSDDRQLRAVLLRGAGKNFCFGASIDMFLATPEAERPLLLRELVTIFHNAISRLARLDVPVLGVVQGSAVGGGVALLSVCDVVIATESARFRLGWPGIGLSMDGGSTAFLPRIIGTRRTLELVYTNRVFTVQEAREWGFVNWIVSDTALDSRAAELAQQFASGATCAFGLSKRLILEGWNQSPEAQMEQEAMAIVQAIRSRDAGESMRAFKEHRPPQFTGE
ncbi:MAG: enoyl-CoA hydratase/isomerase family protein [Thermomicrobiales bacterium]